jgi:hypothetical protein
VGWDSQAVVLKEAEGKGFPHIHVAFNGVAKVYIASISCKEIEEAHAWTPNTRRWKRRMHEHIMQGDGRGTCMDT